MSLVCMKMQMIYVVMIKLRRNGEALLAAALTGFTWSSVGLVEVELRTKRT